MKSHTITGHQVRAGPTAAATIPCHLHPPGMAPGLSLPFRVMLMPSLLPPLSQFQHLVTPSGPSWGNGARRGGPSFPRQVVISGMRLEFNRPVPNPWNSSSQPGPLPWPI